MTSPHQEGKIPWHCLTDYVSLDKYPATPSSSDFRLSKKSDPEARKKSFIHFARVLASRIAEYADGQISAVPKPDASVQEWQFAGVSEEALFPPEFLHGMKQLPNEPSYEGYTRRERWEEISFESDEAAAIVIYAMTKPSKPFLYLPALLYLAQHPRVPMSELRSIYTSGNGDPGLDVYALEWTLNRYLYLNLVLALDCGESFDSGRDMSYRLKIQTDVQQRGAWYYHDENLHRAFWGARDTVPEQLKDPQARAAYSHRCFSVLVSWYAIMSQAVARDRAINLLSTTPFTTDRLTSFILYHLSMISPVFRLPGIEQKNTTYMDSLQSITSPKPPSSSSLPVQHPDRATGRLSRRKSAFIRLPTEIHILIYSFLPLPRSLFSVTLVCKRIHDICTDLIYRDPLGVDHWQGITPHPHQFLQCRDRLVELLDEHHDLANRLRAFSVVFEDNDPPQDMDIASVAPFRWSSARELTTLQLFFSQTAFFRPSPSIPLRTLHVLLQDIARLCPNLLSLRIVLLSGYDILPSNDVSEGLSTVAYSTTLKRFSLSTEGTQIPLCLSPMASSASSLSYVNLDIAEQDIDVRSLPVFPNAKKVGLRLLKPAIEVQLLLRRSFPAVEALHVRDGSPEKDPHPFDFSLSSPSLGHLLVSFYTIGRLPPTLQSLCVRVSYDFGAHCAIAPSVLALLLDRPIPSDNDLKALGTCFPSLRSLHMRSFLVTPFTIEDLPRVALLLALSFPLLDTFIIDVKGLSYRPRRMDYPMPDGLDEVQQGLAVQFFEECSSLHVISFDCIPAEDDSTTLGRFPARVWVRVSDDSGVGARMSSSGRAMLKWKLSEYWEYDDM